MRFYLKVVIAAVFLVSESFTIAAQAETETTNAQKPPGATPPTLHASSDKVLTFGSRAQKKEERLAKANHSALHRLDFRVEGSGCAACLGRVRKRIDALKGVIEVAVAIKKPYGVAVIYDSSKISKDEILKEGKKGESVDIRFVDVQDAPMPFEKYPMILVPVFNSLIGAPQSK